MNPILPKFLSWQDVQPVERLNSKPLANVKVIIEKWNETAQIKDGTIPQPKGEFHFA